MGRRGIELEVKFAPVSEAVLVDLAARNDIPGWRIVARHDEDQRNTYYDTPSATLEANRCSLRRRELTSGIEWTFKRGQGPGRDGVARRREVNALLPATNNGVALAKCEPVRRARKVAGREELVPLFSLRTTRRQLELARADGTRVALALDRLQLEDDPTYRETEIEIELLDGDEGAIPNLSLWLMAEYGLLPLRGSKRGRALAWRRGVGLPVVAPDLAAELLATRVAKHERPPVLGLAAPRGSGQARALAGRLLQRLPGARLITDHAAPYEPLLETATGPLIIEGPDVLETAHADVCVWVKVGLPRPLLARLLADALAAGLDGWTVLRRCGEYVVPVQRHTLDPAAHWADLVVIADAPAAPEAAAMATPREQVKLYGWPSDAALRAAGAVATGADRWHDRFFLPPMNTHDELLRVRLVADTAWVSFRARGKAAAIVTGEARPRVVTLLAGLGYRAAGEVALSRRHYRLDGWELALDRVVGLGYFCEVRRVAPDRHDLEAVLARLGLAGAHRTTRLYRDLAREAETAVVTPDEPTTGGAA